MKIICCLVILLSFVNCQSPIWGEAPIALPNETAVNDSCEKECEEKCVDCQEVVECTEDQTNCGLGKPDPAFGGVCPAQPICVPLDYNCPKPPDCPATKKVNCAEDEILCSTESSDNPDNHCPGPNVCVPRGVDDKGDLCPGFCPIECKDDQLKCQTPIDPITKCAKPAVCVSKSKDDKGNLCPNQQCPIHCDETEIVCTGAPTTLGCKEEDTCAARGKSVSDDLCPGKCPVTCDPIKEVKCNGQKDPAGCVGPDTCLAKARDVNGKFCPDNSDSHGCPTICPEGETLCPAKTDILKCKEQAKCLANTKDNDGNSCPESSVCPTICQPNEVSCPRGIDKNGCSKADICVPQERDYDGDLCPVHCPATCDDKQILCEGHIDDTGCKTEDTCAEREEKTEGNDKGGLCPGVCPIKCEQNEVLCPSQKDWCDGCKTDEVCRLKAKDNNGLFCADDSASHGCPVKCEKGEVVFTPNEAHLGCKPQSICIPGPPASTEPQTQILIEEQPTTVMATTSTTTVPTISIHLPCESHSDCGCLMQPQSVCSMYGHRYCQTEVCLGGDAKDPCTPNLCGKNAICEVVAGGNARCSCPQGMTGDPYVVNPDVGEQCHA